MVPHPVAREGNAVQFDDGTETDVFVMAREWASWREQMLGDRCINPDCDRPATGGVTLYGWTVGRTCGTCLPGVAPAEGANAPGAPPAQRTPGGNNEEDT
jgi:hypothetical protein